MGSINITSQLPRRRRGRKGWEILRQSRRSSILVIRQSRIRRRSPELDSPRGSASKTLGNTLEASIMNRSRSSSKLGECDHCMACAQATGDTSTEKFTKKSSVVEPLLLSKLGVSRGAFSRTYFRVDLSETGRGERFTRAAGDLATRWR